MLGRRLAVVATLALVSTACAQGDQAAITGATVTGGNAIVPVAHTVDAPVQASAARKAPKGAKTAKKVSIRVLPAIAQPGKKAASANSAKTPVSVSVSPRRTTVVTLQRKSGKKWVKVSTAATNRSGKHVFHASTRVKNKAVTYRVVVGKRASNSASTSTWLKPTWTDEFSGRTLSKTWQHQRSDYNPTGFRACSRGSSKAVSVKGGTVALKVMKDTSRTGMCEAKRHGTDATRPVNWRLNGNISTQDKFSFKYGFASARIKFPRSQGQHGSVWMMPQDHVSGVVDPKLTGAEIDIVESFGARNGPKKSQGLSQFTYHWDLDATRTKGIKVKTGGYFKDAQQFLSSKSDNWFDRYHVFSVEWTPSEYIFYVDGKESWRSNVGVSGQRQYMVLSLLSSDYEIHWLEGGEKNINQQMNVDWIRVWETKR